MDDVKQEGREHHAKLGIILHINDQPYGITNLHVAFNSDGIVTIKDKRDELIQFGAFRDHNLFLDTFDISLFNIREELRSLCDHAVTVSRETRKPYALFNGIISDLYGKRVFKCKPSGEDYVYGCKKASTPVDGFVASKDVHDQNAKVLGMSKFLVGHSCEAFAVPGESGTAIAIDNQQDNTILIVGIICGVSNEIENGKYITCCFLPDAVRSIEGKLKTKVQIRIVTSNECPQNELIQCGTTIFFKSPENVCAIDFDISTQLIRYMDLKHEDTKQLLPPYFKNTEHELRHKVFQRKYATNASIFPIDNPEQTIVLNLYACAKFLYENKLTLAEKFLKDGLRIFMKASDKFHLKLICKALTKATWLYLDKGELCKAENMFKEGLDFLKEYNDILPEEYLPYHYYDFSRYFDKLGQTEKAVEMASECFVAFKRTFLRKKTRTSTDRVFLADSLKATALLKCSETFERHQSAVTAQAIQESEETLDYIKLLIEKSPVVQKVEYYLAKCDLEYRKGNFVLALEAATNSSQLSKENNIEEELIWSKNRLEYIRALPKK